MLFEFKLPELGENIESGTVVKTVVAIGDTVQKDQTLIELETEKAVIEVPSPVAGIIKQLPIKEDDVIQVGQLVATLETDVEKKQQGAKPNVQEPNAQNENESAPMIAGISSPEKNVQEVQEVTVNPASQSPGKSAKNVETLPEVAAAPSVRRFAREIGIKIEKVPGSGPGGRISEDDVKAYAKQINTANKTSPVRSGVEQPLPDFAKWGKIERKPMSNIRQKVASHLEHAWQTIPHVTQFDKADITDLEILRKRHSTEKRKLTITPFLMKVVASALKIFPQFNASVDMTTNEIIFKKFFHIGIAVDTDHGLMVPVLRDIDKKSIFQLADELSEIAERARNRKITIEEMQGGTFTITNLGGIGGTQFSPIVNWPEVAILGVSRARMEPIYKENLCTPSLMLPLSLSYDHRLIDGADGARFSNWIVEAIKQPFMMELQ